MMIMVIITTIIMGHECEKRTMGGINRKEESGKGKDNTEG
jgi:hypothetical protein